MANKFFLSLYFIMKILFNNTAFQQECRIIKNGENTVYQYFDDKKILLKTLEIDKFERDVDTIEYELNGEIKSHLHKDYTQHGLIETFKDHFQEYKRTIETVQKGDYTHRIETYISKTSPNKNYVNEFVKDTAGKLLRIINNGKIIEI